MRSPLRSLALALSVTAAGLSAGCRGSGTGACGSANFGPAAPDGTAAFALIAAEGGASNVVLLDADGAALGLMAPSSGTAASVWGTNASRWAGTLTTSGIGAFPRSPITPDAPGTSASGEGLSVIVGENPPALVRFAWPAGGVAHEVVFYGTGTAQDRTPRDVATVAQNPSAGAPRRTVAVRAADVVIFDPDAEPVVPGTPISLSATAGGYPPDAWSAVPVGPAVLVSLGRSDPPVAGITPRAGTGRLVVVDPFSGALDRTLELGMFYACQYAVRLLPAGPPPAATDDARIAVFCSGLGAGSGRVGTGAGVVIVRMSTALGAAPRVEESFRADTLALPSLTSPPVALTGGWVVASTFDGTTHALTALNLQTGARSTLATAAAESGTPPFGTGGAFAASATGGGVLLWPVAPYSVLRFRVTPDGSVPVATNPPSVVPTPTGCGLLRPRQIVALTPRLPSP